MMQPPHRTIGRVSIKHREQVKFEESFPPSPDSSRSQLIPSAPHFHNRYHGVDSSQQQNLQEKQEDRSLNTRAHPANEIQPELYHRLAQQAHTKLELDSTIVHSDKQSASAFAEPVAASVNPPTVVSEAHCAEQLTNGGSCGWSQPGYGNYTVPSFPKFTCPVVPEEQEDKEQEHGDSEYGPTFEPWHLMPLIRLIQDSTPSPWLAQTLLQAQFVAPSLLEVWIEQTLGNYVGFYLSGVPMHHVKATLDGFKKLWIRNILRCNAFAGNCAGWHRFETWLSSVLECYPNLTFALGHNLPFSTVEAMAGLLSSDLPQQSDQHHHEPSAPHGRLQPPQAPVNGAQPHGQTKENGSNWKHYMCNWKEHWHRLEAKHKPLLTHALQIWHHFDEREQAQEATGLVHGYDALVTGYADADDKNYCEYCQQIAWMLRHMYEEHCDADGLPSPTAPGRASPAHEAKLETSWSGLESGDMHQDLEPGTRAEKSQFEQFSWGLHADGEVCQDFQLKPGKHDHAPWRLLMDETLEGVV